MSKSLPIKYVNKLLDLRYKIQILRQIVWLEDIPCPTSPEDLEHHDSITQILKYIDSELMEEEEK